MMTKRHYTCKGTAWFVLTCIASGKRKRAELVSAVQGFRPQLSRNVLNAKVHHILTALEQDGLISQGSMTPEGYAVMEILETREFIA